MPLSQLVISQFLFFAAALIICFASGSIVNAFIKYPDQKPFRTLFLQLLLGLILVSFAASVYFTQFKTVQVLFVFLAFAIAYELNHFTKFEWKFPNADTLIQALVISISLFAFFFLRFYDFGLQSAQIPAPDQYFYSTQATQLSDLGYENNMNVYNYLHAAYQHISPYHYFEIWVNVFFSKLFGIDSTSTFYFITYPLFYSIALIGILALAELYVSTLKLVHLLIALLFLFVGPVAYPYFGVEWLNPESFILGVFTVVGYKYMPFYLGIIALLLVPSGNWKVKVFVLLGMSVASVSVLPATAGVAILLCLRYINKEERMMLTYCVLFVMSYALKYLFIDAEEQFIGGASDIIFTADVNYIFKKLSERFLLTPLRFVLMYLPALVMAVYLYKGKFTSVVRNENVQILFALGVLGLGASFLLGLNPNFNQLFANLFVPVCNIVVVIWLFKLTEVNTNTSRILALAAFAFIVNSNLIYNLNLEKGTTYSAEYVKNSKGFLEKNYTQGIGGFLKDGSEYHNYWDKHPLMCVNAYPLSFAKNFKGMIILNDSVLTQTTEKYFENYTLQYSYISPYYQYRKNTLINYTLADFVSKNKLYFVALSAKAELPASLVPLSDTIITDSISGEKIVFLKKQ